MNQKPWKVYAFWIVLTEAVGGLGGFLIRDGVRRYAETALKPPGTPPELVFPIVWTILYALMGVSAARIDLSDGRDRLSKSLFLYLIQLGFNFLWSIFFFRMQAYGFSFVWLLLLWGLILAMILAFVKKDRLAGWLQIPYLIWVSYAGYLNLGVWLLNR